MTVFEGATGACLCGWGAEECALCLLGADAARTCGRGAAAEGRFPKFVYKDTENVFNICSARRSMSVGAGDIERSALAAPEFVFCSAKRADGAEPFRIRSIDKLLVADPGAAPRALESPLKRHFASKGAPRWARAEALERAHTSPAHAGCPAAGHHAPALPTLGAGKSDSLLRVGTETVSELLRGERAGVRFTIIDCRFRYEYEGGHIASAVNVCSFEALLGIFEQRAAADVLIFHCEYSSLRAPRLAAFFRNEDRKRNVYPRLCFPHVYVMEGGYREFFSRYPELCAPMSYTPMDSRGPGAASREEMAVVRKKGGGRAASHH